MKHKLSVSCCKRRFFSLSVRSFSGQSPSSPCSEACGLPKHFSEPRTKPNAHPPLPGRICITLSACKPIKFLHTIFLSLFFDLCGICVYLLINYNAVHFESQKFLSIRFILSVSCVAYLLNFLCFPQTKKLL